MTLTRRTFLKGTAALTGAALATRVLAADGKPGAKILVSSCSIGSLVNAKKAGLEGMEVGVGGAAEKLSIADPATIQKYKDQMKETGLVVSSIMMSIFNSNPLASDPNGPAWLEQTIGAAKELKAHTILVAFFGKGSLGSKGDVKKADVDVVVERLKAAAPRAKDAGVFLGIENTLPAAENMKILERINNPAVSIYYDCYNLAGQGYDVPAEIRLLKDRISIVHFKNGSDYLEGGKMKWEPIAAAMKEIGYQGWIVLETSAPSKDGVADARKNAEYIRKLFGMA
ncbi:MAG: sugar phosphate isomerase/epimerase [Planctomycetota bacterium]|nr:sugar phosphate isomerase/epimerase [Planctomycetota bacterium]